MTRLGQVQATDGWASFTGMARLSDGEEAPILVFVDQGEAVHPGGVGTVTIYIGDEDPIEGTVDSRQSITIDVR